MRWWRHRWPERIPRPKARRLTEKASKDRTRVLVRFSAASLTESFGGTCPYLKRDGSWGAYPIKPSESRTIFAAETWLVKRKWKAWC